MSSMSTVGVDNNLSTSQPTISMWAANNEPTRGINEVFGSGIEPLLRDHFPDDLFHHKFSNLSLSRIFRMLCRNHDGIHSFHNSILILDCHLAFAVWTKKGNFFR